MPTYDKSDDTKITLAAPNNNINAWTVDDIKKSDILVFRQSATEYIDTIVAPNGFQVGLLDEQFITDLLVTGNITGSGVIYAELGFSGSLTKLIDGSDYLVAGSGITLLTQSNGSIIISSTGEGGGATPIDIIAGDAISYQNSLLDVLKDDITIGINGSNELRVLRTPGTLTAGSGLNSTSFNGSTNVSFSVKPLANTPITVSSLGVGFDLPGQQSAIQLANSDEILIWDGTGYKKTTVEDLISLVDVSASGAPTDASYLTITNNPTLSHERQIVMGDGLEHIDTGPNGNYIVAVSLDANGHLEFVNGKLAVNIGSFAGLGLVENEITGKLDLDYSLIVGIGLQENNGTISVDFGNNSGQVASGNSLVTIDAGDGLEGGGNFFLGDLNPTIVLNVNSEDIAGVGLYASDNDLQVNLEAGTAISITTGSNGQLIITNTNGIVEIPEYIFGEGLLSDGQSPETITVDFGSNIGQVASGNNTIEVITSPGLLGDSVILIGESSVINLELDLRAENGISIVQDGNTLVFSGQEGILDIVSGSGTSVEITDQIAKVNIQYSGSNNIVSNAYPSTGEFIYAEDTFLVRQDSSNLVKEFSIQDLIDILPNSGGSSNYISGSGIVINSTAIPNTQEIAVNYEGVGNLVLSAMTDASLLLESLDTLLINDISDNIVKQVTLSDISNFVNSNSSSGNLGTINRIDYIVSSETPAYSSIYIQGLDLSSNPNFDPSKISVYLNGQLLRYESLVEIEGGNGDYTIETLGPLTYLKFSSTLDINDLITVQWFDSDESALASAKILTWADEPNAQNSRTVLAGDGISIDTTVDGEFTINAIGLPRETDIDVLERRDITITEFTSSLSPITFINLIPTISEPGDYNISIYLNGQLLKEGTEDEVLIDLADYYVEINGTDLIIYILQDLEINDLVTAMYTKLGHFSNSSFLTWQEDGNLENSRVITPGEGISISTINPREFLISNTGIVERKKYHELTAIDYSSSEVYSFSSSVDFSTVNYSDDRIDLFINGILKIKGIHFELSDTDNSLQNNDIKFINGEFVESGSIISAIICR